MYTSQKYSSLVKTEIQRCISSLAKITLQNGKKKNEKRAYKNATPTHA